MSISRIMCTWLSFRVDLDNCSQGPFFPLKPLLFCSSLRHNAPRLMITLSDLSFPPWRQWNKFSFTWNIILDFFFSIVITVAKIPEMSGGIESTQSLILSQGINHSFFHTPYERWGLKTHWQLFHSRSSLKRSWISVECNHNWMTLIWYIPSHDLCLQGETGLMKVREWRWQLHLMLFLVLHKTICP